MRKLIILGFLVMSSAAWGQSAGSKASRVDPCKPIGRTDDGRLVYGLACDHMPAPAPRSAAAAPPADSPPPVVEEDKGGLFGMHAPSFIRPTTDADRPAGVGPALSR